jgi:hypothetical protein
MMQGNMAITEDKNGNRKKYKVSFREKIKFLLLNEYPRGPISTSYS